MWILASLCLWLLNFGLADDENKRGYPFYFASFEDVGQSRLLGDVLPLNVVDNYITEWTKGCPADAFVLIRDASPFQLSGLRRLQRAAENSLTTGSVLSNRAVDLHELGLDLEDYCEGEFVEVKLEDLDGLPKYMDTKTRVYYIDFPEDATPDVKNETMNAVLAAIPSPFVTLAYVSSVPQSQPILRSINLNPKRSSWQRQKLRHNRDKIAPVIAPLFEHKNVGHLAPEPRIDLPDNFFFTLLLGSILAVSLLAYRDLTSSKARKPSKAEPKKSRS